MEKNGRIIEHLRIIQSVMDNLNNESKELGQYFQDVYGVDACYGERVVIPKIMDELEFLKSNVGTFLEHPEPSPAYISNQSISSRIGPIGVVT